MLQTICFTMIEMFTVVADFLARHLQVHCHAADAGAHTGKGLGRMFLRHLRRTRVLLHVVDASAPDPATDYLAVREELRMYNPSYVTRPHVVALNKMDIEDAGAGVSSLTHSATVVLVDQT